MKKVILIGILISNMSIFAKLELAIQNKLTHLNVFSTIYIGTDTNQIKVETLTNLNYGYTNNNNDFYFSMIILC